MNFIDRARFLFGISKKAYFEQRIPIDINKGAVQFSTQVPYEIYNTLSQIKVPVNRLGNMFSNGVFRYKKKGSEDYIDLPPDLAALLAKPNIFQRQNTWMFNYLCQLLVYGDQFMYKNQASALALPKSLINVSPAHLKPQMTGSIFDQIEMSGIVSYYEYTENGKLRRFETDSIMWSKIPDLDNPVMGCGLLKALNYDISNIELAYKYLNAISGEKGAIGALTQEPAKDSMGALPMSESEKTELENQYRKTFGVDGDRKILISSTPVKWQPFSYPTKDLMLKEQIDDNFLMILHTLGVNPNCYINSTYENLRHGLASTHNDTVQPHADAFCQSLSEFIGIKPGYELVLDYSHLPYLQKDNKETADTFASVSNALNSLVTSGIIDTKQAADILLNQFGIKVK